MSQKYSEKCDICERTYPYIRRTFGELVVYVDHENRKWTGKQCFSCHEERKVYNSKSYALTNRPCRRCGKQLPSVRYFTCLKCKPVVNGDMWGDHVWGAPEGGAHGEV